jgi:hypothetical protein
MAKQRQPSFMEIQPQGRFIAPDDSVRQMIEPQGVVEHTTRRMAGK